MVVATPDDLVHAVSRDRRMAGYRVRRQGDGWIELEVVSQRPRMPVLLVLAWPDVWRDPAALRPHLIRARSGNYGLVLVGSDTELEDARLDHSSHDVDLTALAGPISMVRLLLLLRSRADAIAMRMTSAAGELELERARHENDMLISIGRALSQQRDIQSLLAIILKRACEVTSADAGSVYIVEGHDEEVANRTLRFAASQNESRAIESKGFSMPVTATSIVGSCVLSGERINVPDLYKLDAPGTGNNPWGFIHDRTFDDKYRYQGRSVLAVPMISARDEVIGVIQLINKRAKGWIQLSDASDFEEGVVAVRQRVGDVCPGARVAGRHRARERAALRGSPDAVRELREGVGHRDREPRSDDVGSQRARRRARRSAWPRRSTRRRRAGSATFTTPTSTSRRSATPRCSTTSARSACASTCSSRRRSSTSTSAS